MQGFGKLESDIKSLVELTKATHNLFKGVPAQVNKNNGLNAKTREEITKLFRDQRSYLLSISNEAKSNPNLRLLEQQAITMLARIEEEQRHLNYVLNDQIGQQTKLASVQALIQLFGKDFQESQQLKRLLDLVRFTKYLDPNEFIIQENLQTFSIACSYYQRKDKIPRKGVIIIPGFSEHRLGYRGLALMIANEGYAVMTMDLPSQGGSVNSAIGYSIGLAAEWVAYVAQRMRYQYKVDRIGVVGHSHGAFSALFAAGGYSEKVEHDIFEFARRYQEADAELGMTLSKTLTMTDEQKIQTIIKNREIAYEGIKSLLVESIKRLHFNEGSTQYPGKIDAIVALGPPPSTQYAIKDMKFLLAVMKNKRVPYQVVRLATNLIKKAHDADRSLDGKFKKMHTEFDVGNGPAMPKGVASVLSTAVYDKKAFAEYLMNMKNPYDYFNLLRFFSQDDKGAARSQLISYFVRKYLQTIPKLFIYGGKDQFQKGLSAEQVEGVYTICANAASKSGNLNIIRYDDMTHGLSDGRDPGNDGRTIVGASGAVTNDIISFLNHHL
ncbi:MAG: alpha/beta fold hydrolase [Nanoarchaeota archaeon]